MCVDASRTQTASLTLKISNFSIAEGPYIRQVKLKISFAAEIMRMIMIYIVPKIFLLHLR